MLARANPGTTIAGGFARMIMLLFGTCPITQRPARFGFRVRRSRTNLSRSLLPLNEGPATIETAGSPQVGIKWPPWGGASRREGTILPMLEDGSSLRLLA